MTAAASPLDHTILSGQFHVAKAPLVLGNEGAGVGRGRRRTGTFCRFTSDVHGSYGVFEDGAYSEWPRRTEGKLCLIPEMYVVSAAGFRSRISRRKTRHSPSLVFRQENRAGAGGRRIGWQRGDAIGGLPWAQSTPMSSTTKSCESRAGRRRSDSMRSLIPPWRSWVNGVRRITAGYGAPS